MSETVKEVITILKHSIPEKTIVENMLEFSNHPRKIKSLGEVKDIDSDFRNEYFDEIYQDERGVIIDLRFCNEILDEDELSKISDYWEKLVETYSRPVEPIFLLTPRE